MQISREKGMHMPDSFSFSGKYYTTEELESLATGDRELILRTCGARHTEKSINAMMCRLRNPAYTGAGTPRTLQKLCVKLGIIPPRRADYSRGGKFMNSYRREVVRFLSSLPNADGYDEEQWLDTPELWAFVDFSRIADANGEKGSRLPDELRRRMKLWRDGWIPLKSVYPSCQTIHPDSVYMIPDRQVFSCANIPRLRKSFLLERTFIPESCVTFRQGRKIPLWEIEKILELLGRMSVGRVSFLCGMSIAEMLQQIGKIDDKKKWLTY